MDKYKYIKNPLTNRNVKIDGKLGRSIIQNFVKKMTGGLHYNSRNNTWMGDINDECAICGEALSFRDQDEDPTGEISVLRECGHTFHKYCIERWLSRKNECPLCKTTVQNQESVISIARAETNGTVTSLLEERQGVTVPAIPGIADRSVEPEGQQQKEPVTEGQEAETQRTLTPEERARRARRFRQIQEQNQRRGPSASAEETQVFAPPHLRPPRFGPGSSTTVREAEEGRNRIPSQIPRQAREYQPTPEERAAQQRRIAEIEARDRQNAIMAEARRTRAARQAQEAIRRDEEQRRGERAGAAAPAPDFAPGVLLTVPLTPLAPPATVAYCVHR